METEKHLLQELKNGDRQAARRLYERYGGLVAAIGMRYVANTDTVRDVVQNVFVKVLSSVGRFEFRGEGSLRAWMARIAVNESLNYLRHELTWSSLHELDEQDIPEEEAIPERVPPDVLTHLIGELPIGYRTVLNLYVFEQLSHKEIAERLGITESTSGSQYMRAKRLLSTKINHYLKQEER